MDKKLLTIICLTLLYPFFAFGFTHTLVWAPPTNNTTFPNDTYVKGYYLQQSTNRLPILWIDTAFSPIKKP